MAERMGDFIENRDGTLWIPNPVLPEENFADRWRAHPERARAFFVWLAALREEVARLSEGGGLDRITKRIDSAFGSGVGQRVARRFGEGIRQAREAGELRASPGTARLGREGSPVRPHTFFGGRGKR
jgi:hypothetical protein